MLGCPEPSADDGDTMSEDETDGGDGDGDTGDGDGDTGNTGCFDQPPICEQFVRCIAAVAPTQAETVEEQYGPEGSCWCGATEDKAQECYETCIEQVDLAIQNNPTESQCHENVCSLDELDPDQPYGPVVNGACSDYLSLQGQPVPQTPFQNPLGLEGHFCAPKCSGLANACPEHNQTSAQGTCFLVLGEDNYCISRCYVDPTVLGGTQCQCGSICRPYGTPDGEGNMRGLCTFPD